MGGKRKSIEITEGGTDSGVTDSGATDLRVTDTGGTSAEVVTVVKVPRQKKTFTLETKLDILRRFDKREKATDIALALGLPLSTVKTIKNRDGNKIREAAKTITSLDAKMMTRTRSSLMMKMESLLSIWIDNQVEQGIPLSRMAIQTKAKSLFEDIKNELAVHDGSVAIPGTSAFDKEETFEASNGWFKRFKTRTMFSMTLKGEEVSADNVAADRFLCELKALIHTGGYTPKQVFNVDETGLFWKRLPSGTFISKIEKSAPGFKAGKDRLSLLLGGNAHGDFKFKPLLVYHSENPRAMRGFPKEQLPVHWRANKKAWMTPSLFKDWVSNCAIPEIQAYCKKENIYFKALVLVDNAPGHPVYVDDLSENVKFVFLPRNTSVIQPMDQGVISTFKCYYLRRIFQVLLSLPDDPSKLEFWKRINIMNGIEMISDSWKEVKTTCMNGAWRRIWPESVRNLRGENLEIDDEQEAVCQQIVNLANLANFEGMDRMDIGECLSSHNREMTNEELMQLELECAIEEDHSLKVLEQRNLTSKHLFKAMSFIDEAIEIFLKNDPDCERSSTVAWAVANDINCYKELYLNLKKQKTVERQLKEFNYEALELHYDIE